MFAPSLSDQLALVTVDPALAGQAAGLVAVVGAQATKLATLREEMVELRWQLARHSSRWPNGQPDHTSRTRIPVASAQIDVGIGVEYCPDRCRSVSV
jgi:hypothetical protein